jgi:hypothetical protein
MAARVFNGQTRFTFLQKIAKQTKDGYRSTVGRRHGRNGKHGIFNAKNAKAAETNNSSNLRDLRVLRV